jgi:Polyketide cyclase / dehydrase and lipid transport
MLTISQTRTITIDAPPSAVLDCVGDPRRLPSWAPDFAHTVRPDGEHWVVNDAATIDVRVDRATGTIDIVAADDHRRGAFSRVLPNGDGSEFLFTLFFPPGTDDAAVSRQMAVVDEELHRVRAMCEG